MRNNQREAKYQRILNENRYRSMEQIAPKEFYALVVVNGQTKDVDGEKVSTNKTYVVGGLTRNEAENNAYNFMERYGLKGKIDKIVPIR